jgi:MoaA/NifB/PqqE/SkfB family radical SAM enzyme
VPFGLPMFAPTDDDAVLPSPIEAYFEVANRCNSKCATCPLTLAPQEAAHQLGYDEFVAIVAQLPDLKRAVMHGIGEPLLNRTLPRLIAHLKARGVYVLFNSNALLLTDVWQAALIDSGLDELRVSIDGSTPETYHRIRGVKGLDRVLENVASMVRLKRRRGVTTPRISFWMTGMRDNLPELPDVMRLAARIGVDEVYLQRMVYSGAGMAVAEQSVFAGADTSAAQIIAEATRLADQLGVAFSGAGAISPSESQLGHHAESEPWRGCSRPRRLLYVTANGNALPCCIAPLTGVPYADIVLGNVVADDVDAVWHGERYQQFRDRLYSSNPNDACRRCGVGWSL